MNLIYTEWHKGHNRELLTAGGKIYAHCLDCSIVADLEAVSTKISPQTSFHTREELDEMAVDDQVKLILGRTIGPHLGVKK